MSKEVYPEFPDKWDDQKGPPPGWQLVDTSGRFPGAILPGELMRGFPVGITYRPITQEGEPKLERP